MDDFYVRRVHNTFFQVVYNPEQKIVTVRSNGDWAQEIADLLNAGTLQMAELE